MLHRGVRWLAEWHPAVLLGLVTIGAYGIAQYAIGVLIPAIHDDTGWGTGQLSSAFALGVLLSGLIALAAGSALDRFGSRPVLSVSLLVGGGTLLAASTARDARWFIVTWGSGAALIGGGLYYPMTMATLARMYPEERTRALAILTLIGALASPIFYPLAGWLVAASGWREATRVLVLVAVLLSLPGALLAHAPRTPRRGTGQRRTPLLEALRSVRVVRLLMAVALASAATSTLHLHQVPAMQASGLSLAAASGFAGARGFLQIPGRLLLERMVGGLGLRGTAALAYGAGALGAAAMCLALLGGPPAALAAIFALTAGFAVGLLSPVHGLLAASTYEDERLGTLSGVQQFVASIAGAAGPWLSGVLVDSTGGYLLPMTVPLAALVCAILVITYRGQTALEAQPATDYANP